VPWRDYVRLGARSAAVPFSRSTGRRHARSSAGPRLPRLQPLAALGALGRPLVTFTFDLRESRS